MYVVVVDDGETAVVVGGGVPAAADVVPLVGLSLASWDGEGGRIWRGERDGEREKCMDLGDEQMGGAACERSVHSLHCTLHSTRRKGPLL